jgi:hypothetical protein
MSNPHVASEGAGVVSVAAVGRRRGFRRLVVRAWMRVDHPPGFT